MGGPILLAMRIVGSNIQLASAHLFEAQLSVRERLQVRLRPAGDEDSFRPEHPSTDRDVDKLTKLLRRYFERAERGESTEKLSQRIDALVKRIEARLSEEPSVRIDVRYRRQESYREVEATSFRASGSVTTADGRQIDFAEALDLARAYARTETVSLRATALVPSGSEPTPTEAPETPAAADESPRQALALGGSVLGLDANADGHIDPATELVGGSGNGFAELQAYDQDGNGFIDEGDEVFGKLALVSSGEDGLASTSLAEGGVGAIYLESVATPYTFRGADGDVSAQLSRSGIYLNEAGTTGMVHQIDVVI